MKIEKFIKWLPRIIAIIFIFFLSIFSLDVFSMEGTFLQKMEGLLMHNIPTLILIFLLIFAWKRELIGGIIFIAIGILFTAYFNTYQRIDSFILISIPPMLAGALFILSGYKKV